MVGLERIPGMGVISRDLSLSGGPKVLLRTNESRAKALRASVAEKFSPDYAEEIEAHFEYMPDHYFRATGVPEIIEH